MIFRDGYHVPLMSEHQVKVVDHFLQPCMLSKAEDSITYNAVNASLL